jgi:protein-disulfide isomerase
MKKLILLAMSFIILGCTASKDDIKKIIKNNPDIITEAIEAHPVKFIEALNTAVRKAQGDQAKQREDEEKKQLEEAFNNPMVAEIRSDELIRGTKGAPITLVEYSDFECPFCSRAFETVVQFLEKYKGKVQFVYKHLPLDFHPQAMVASEYYEAIRLQSPDKAIKFHDEVYKNQAKLRLGESFVKGIAKSLNVDMNKLAKDIKSDAVQNRIQEDMDEARKYGFQGTPGFLLNGVPIRGFVGVDYFENILEELKKRGMLKL